MPVLEHLKQYKLSAVYPAARGCASHRHQKRSLAICVHTYYKHNLLAECRLPLFHAVQQALNNAKRIIALGAALASTT